MTTATAPILWIGSRDGLLRWQAGAVTPIIGEAAVTALARLPGGRVAAGLESGDLVVAARDGTQTRRLARASRAAITSLLTIAGHGETWWLGTAAGELLESRDGGAHFELRWRTEGGALRVLSIPGRPRSALLLVEGSGVWLVSEPGQPPQLWSQVTASGSASSTHPIAALASHPFDGQVWLARTATTLLRSIDGARTFRPVIGWPADRRPRIVHFTDLPRGDAYAISWPPPMPPDPTDPSSLWKSIDGGQSFHPVASRQIDRARNPVGELTAVAAWLEGAHDRDVVILGTDRGELLQWDGQDGHCDLLADQLPPIDHLLAAGPAPILDPSTSGVFLLP